MGIRTPDLLHAISRHHVHRGASVLVTVLRRALRSARVRAGCGTSVLYSPAGPQKSTDVAVLADVPSGEPRIPLREA
jgi:hypothetical protein